MLSSLRLKPFSKKEMTFIFVFFYFTNHFLIFSIQFSSFINKYRIEDAKKLIVDTKHSHLTFEAIANAVGFNSKASFNAAFKKFTETTPSLYKKQFE